MNEIDEAVQRLEAAGVPKWRPCARAQISTTTLYRWQFEGRKATPATKKAFLDAVDIEVEEAIRAKEKAEKERDEARPS